MRLCPSHSESFQFFIKRPFAERPISPLDDNGEPIDPLNLPEFLKARNWDSPFCFCVARGPLCRVQFHLPVWEASPAYNSMCLVCPTADCPYFGEYTCSFRTGHYDLKLSLVNISELLVKHRVSVLSVQEAESTESDSEALSDVSKCI